MIMRTGRYERQLHHKAEDLIDNRAKALRRGQKSDRKRKTLITTLMKSTTTITQKTTLITVKGMTTMTLVVGVVETMVEV